MLKVYNMRYPTELINHIDRFKERQGFGNRSQTVIYLLQYALNGLDKKEEPSDNNKTKEVLN